MNRWQKAPKAHLFIAACSLLASFSAIFSSESWAQMQRIFPQSVERGVVKFSEVPLEVKLNGKDERLAPGARVRGPQNTFVLNYALVGQTFTVNYLRDPAGMVRDIWLLTPEEAQTLPDGSAAPTPSLKRFDASYGG